MSAIKTVYIGDQNSIDGREVAKLIGRYRRDPWDSFEDKQYGGPYSAPRYTFEEGFGNDLIEYRHVFIRGMDRYQTVLAFHNVQLDKAVFSRSGWDLLIKPYGGVDAVRVKDYFAEVNGFIGLYSPYGNISFEFEGKNYRYADIKSRIAGLDGPGQLSGTEGNDRLIGGTGANDISGGKGHDRIEGDGGDDRLFGGEGNDRIIGSGGNDTLTGDAGDDYLYGDAGSDIFIGGQGDDHLIARYSGSKPSYGERSADTFVFAKGHGSDTVDYYEYPGNKESSVLDFQGALFSDARYAREGNNLIIKAYGGQDQVLVKDFFNKSGLTFKFADKTFSTAAEAKQFVLSLNLPDSAQLNRITGTNENESFQGTDGNDKIDGQSGEDVYIGGKGNDIFSGLGAKTYIFAKGHGQDTIEGVGELVFEEAYAADAVFSRSGNNLVVQAYQDESQVVVTDYFLLSSSSVEQLKFSFADQTLTHQEMLQRKFTHQGTEADNYLYAGEFEHTLYGGEGDDSLMGSPGRDVFIGGEGNDRMVGDEPVYPGKNGSDTYVFAKGHGQDKIIDLGRGAEDTNILRFEAANSYQTKFSRQGNDLIIRAYGGEDQVTLKYYFAGKEYEGTSQIKPSGRDYRYFQFEFGEEILTYDDMAKQIIAGKGSPDKDILMGSNTQDILQGRSGDDQISGGGSKDKLYGEKGADTIWGDDGNDDLYGGSDNDKLYGGIGNDTLTGGFGNDLLYGQTGSDTYLFSKLHGKDTVVESGSAAETDTVKFTDMAMSEFMFKKQDHHLVIFDEGGTGSVEFRNFFLNPTFQVEQFEFSDKKITAPDFQKHLNQADTAYSMSVFDNVGTAAAPAEVLG